MIDFDPMTIFVLFLTPIGCLTIGYWLGRMDSTPTSGGCADPRLAYARAELHGFACGMVAALVAIHSKTDPPSRSPPVSGAGLPVAGAGGETG